MGYPALVPGDEGEVAVDLFESPALPDHWARLDALEGEGYERRTIMVRVDGEEIPAFIYAARQALGHRPEHRAHRHEGDQNIGRIRPCFAPAQGMAAVQNNPDRDYDSQSPTA